RGRSSRPSRSACGIWPGPRRSPTRPAGAQGGPAGTDPPCGILRSCPSQWEPAMTVDRSVLERPAPLPWTEATRRAAPPWVLLPASLILLDGVALFVAFGLAYLVRFETGLPLLEQLPYRRAFYEGVAFWGVPLWVGIFALCRLYDPRHLFA